MSRYIDADEIKIPHFTLATDRLKMIDAIDDTPSADVVERKRGSYTNTKDDYEWYARMHTCDLCGKSWMGDTNFCPNCGADMRADRKE